DPAHMGEPETAAGGVGVAVVVVHVGVMAAVVGDPVQDIVLQGAGASQGEDEADHRVSLVGLVGPQAVVAGGNGHATETHENDEGRPLKGVVTLSKAVPGDQGYGK